MIRFVPARNSFGEEGGGVLIKRQARRPERNPLFFDRAVRVRIVFGTIVRCRRRHWRLLSSSGRRKKRGWGCKGLAAGETAFARGRRTLTPTVAGRRNSGVTSAAAAFAMQRRRQRRRIHTGLAERTRVRSIRHTRRRNAKAPDAAVFPPTRLGTEPAESAAVAPVPNTTRDVDKQKTSELRRSHR